jgi:hypothetical protein
VQPVWVQLPLARHVNDAPKIREFLWRLADAYDRDGEPAQSEQYLKELLAMTLTKKQELEALTYLADIQVDKQLSLFVEEDFEV